MLVISDEAEWEKAFKLQIEPIHGECGYKESAEMLSSLVKSGILRFDDIQYNPKRFFLAHRLLLSPKQLVSSSGFGVRLTVQFNLFAGTILGLGSPKQVQMLEEFQRDGVLGCFCLTEAFAGVHSGLVVHTTATWIKEKQRFCINSPTEGSKKNWISQGLTASFAIVIAKLIIENKDYGAHAFLIRIRDSGILVPGVSVVDMGMKTVANDLDNAVIAFDNVLVDEFALLSRYSKVSQNRYIQNSETSMRLEVLGQRLLTGRLAIAQGSCVIFKHLVDNAKQYACKKMCWAPAGKQRLIDVPHIADIVSDCESGLETLTQYNSKIEVKLCKVLRLLGIPNEELVEQISVAKIRSTQVCINLAGKLQSEIGSFALTRDSGFGAAPWLHICQFAEGDSRILMQKLARDRMKRFVRDPYPKSMALDPATAYERKCCADLSSAISASKSKSEALKLWNVNWKLVYKLADAICLSYVAKELGNSADSIRSRL